MIDTLISVVGPVGITASVKRALWCVWLAVAAVAGPGRLYAQGDVEMFGRIHGTRPPAAYYEVLRSDPTAFQFSPDNGWIRRGRAVAQLRAQRRAEWLLSGYQAPRAAFDPSGVMVGELNVPVFLILYENTDSASLVANVPRDSIEFRLYGTHTPEPYSVHNYYLEISNGNLTVNGTVLDWMRVSGADTLYEAGCNGLCADANAPIAAMIREMVEGHDATLDYGQFDNDGADGVPNSGDDDGFVDAIVLIHPEVDATCGNSNLWAHKWTYQNRSGGADLETQDDAAGGGKIKIRDYIIQGGQGGDNGCTADEPQSMGVVAHETGHIFGLPDLYNTNGSRSSEGIGSWGLMGTGNWLRPNKPAHMEAWSRAQLGWVTEILIDSDTIIDLSPVEQADTAYVLPIAGTDEYFLLENRQPLGSDGNLLEPGLLIWHIDSVRVRERRFSNTVNSFDPEAVRLIQADGAGHLQAGSNRGDQSDPFPGATGNTAFGYNTDPASNDNDGNPTYIQVDQIEQLSALGPVRARISFARPSLIAAEDTLAAFVLDGNTLNRFDGLLQAGTEHTLDMDSVQIVNDGRNRYTWVAWSNGQARSHTFTASVNGDTIIATVQTDYLVEVTIVGTGGSVTSDPPGDVEAGAFMPKDSTVTLVATVTDTNQIFEGWSGDVASSNDTLVIVMTRPYILTATFAAPLAMGTEVPDTAVMGSAYSFTFTATGGTGVYSWQLSSGTLPSGLALSSGGELVGTPTEAGSYTFEVKVSSGSQEELQSVSMEVVKPQLIVADIVAELLGSGSGLSAGDISFLDLIGNNNGRLDLGDFLAWLADSGVTASPGVISQVMKTVSNRTAAVREQQ